MRLWFVLPSALLCACAAPAAPSGPDDDPEPDPGGVSLPIPEEMIECRPSAGDEPVGEACQPLLCEMLCFAASYLGCAGAWAACLAGEPVTDARLVQPGTRGPMAAVLADAAAPLDEAALAARFTGKGPWKKRLPQIIDTLEALGRVRRDASGTRIV